MKQEEDRTQFMINDAELPSFVGESALDPEKLLTN